MRQLCRGGCGGASAGETGGNDVNTYIVLYRDDSLPPLAPPLAFRCDADDTEHAEEQCENAYPEALIIWVVQTDSVGVALGDWYAGSQAT